MFRRLVVVGLVLSLGSSLLGCASYPKYGAVMAMECDLPDRGPAEILYYRYVMTESWDKYGSGGYDHREIKWGGVAVGSAWEPERGEWTREEIRGADGEDIGWPSAEACSQHWLDEATTKAPTTTKAKIATTSTKAARKYSSSDPEYKLAAIDKNTQRPSDSAIAPYARALDALRGKCNEGRTKLGDMAVVAQEMFEDIGEQLSLLEILRLVDRSIPADWPGKMNCVQVYGSLVILSS